MPPAPPKSASLLRKLAALPKAALNSDLEPFLDFIFERLEFLFVRAERWLPFLRPKRLVCGLDLAALFNGDKPRENFLPVRLSVLAAKLVASARTPLEQEKTRRFVERCGERLHYDFFRAERRLYDAFAPFDSDADAFAEPPLSSSETARRRAALFAGVLDVLRACNFVELPKEELKRCLRLKRPGSAPVVARYDEFFEYRIFVRGVVKTPSVAYPRWKCAGRIVEVESERLSRVCVLARLKPRSERRFVDADAQAPPTADSDADDFEREQEIVVKLFKNVPLEDLKIAAPRVELAFPLFDGIKIGGGFLGTVVAASLKLFLASAITLVGFLVLLASFATASLKSAFGFLNRRTKYWERYSSSLYFQTLASNRAALALLVAMAEEQETKELLLGYFVASRLFDDWATERELDAAAERWLAENFKLDVDFESSDALRKLLEKRLVERRVDADAERFRAVSLDEALRRLEADWRDLARRAP
ncbi:MAG: DUF3754 domain-containing protein [Thermoguttaceae bacterium]|nr:DUF3754 domain-containing protein [Thermoguttaceae bacterium]